MTIKLPPISQSIEGRLSDFAVACAIMDGAARASTANRLREAITDYAREAVRLNMAPLSDDPNWRHPKIQGLIGSEARLRIQIDLIWRILEDPNQGFGPSDMEYWDTLHDKLKSTLAAHGIKGETHDDLE